MHYVIIGNGVTGINAANELRRRDEKARITIISSESKHFFSRTALMYEFSGQMSREDLQPYENDHYEVMGFERIFDEVTALDVSTKTLKIKGGSSCTYDKLLIACGSVAAKAPWHKEINGVGHFVTLDDLEWLKQVAIGGKQKKRCAVVGGGLIGVEASEILLLEGCQVHFLIREEWYWPIALDKKESAFVAEHMRSHGCHVHFETEIEEILESDGKLSGVLLNNNEQLELDFLVVAIGVTPATAWLENSPIALSHGFHKAIEVDQYLQTNQVDVFAAGDCANVEWFDGKRRPEQLWYTGREQGRVAARNMLGDKVPYERGPLYNSAKFFDLEYTTAGLVNFPIENQKEWYQEVPGKPISQRIVLQDDRVVGFNMIGSRWDHRVFLKWIEERRDLEFVLSQMKDAVFDAEFATPFRVYENAAVSEA